MARRRNNSDNEVKSFQKKYNNRHKEQPRHQLKAQTACLDARGQALQGNHKAARGLLKAAVTIVQVGKIKTGK